MDGNFNIDKITIDYEAFMLRVLAAFDEIDCHDMLFWRTNEYAPISFFVNCSDTFYWATADLEPITPANVHELEDAIASVKAAIKSNDDNDVHEFWAPYLFCCRMRQQRPMPRVQVPNCLKALFDACGPERTSNDSPE